MEEVLIIVWPQAGLLDLETRHFMSLFTNEFIYQEYILMTKSKLEKGILKGLKEAVETDSMPALRMFDGDYWVSLKDYKKLKKSFNRMKAIYDELQHVRMK